MHTGLETDDITHSIRIKYRSISLALPFDPIAKVKFEVTLIASSNSINQSINFALILYKEMKGVYWNCEQVTKVVIPLFDMR